MYLLQKGYNFVEFEEKKLKINVVTTLKII